MKKRKACGVDEKGREINLDALKGSYANDVTVSTSDNGIVIEMKCPSRAGRMLEIMEAINSFNIDFSSVQSTEADGNLYLTIKSVVSIWICLFGFILFCIQQNITNYGIIVS